MKNLRVINNIVFLFIFAGCTTTTFNIKKEADGVTELLVTPDRVLLQCEELDEEPDSGAYGFMVHILDEKNTVVTSALNIRPDKKTCECYIYTLSHILKNGYRILIGSRGSISVHSRTNDEERFHYTFSGHGTFSSNGRSLDFDFMANEKGQCYGPAYGDNESCPQFPFSLKEPSF